VRFPRSSRLLLTGVSAAAIALLLAQSAFADQRDFRLQNNSSVDIAFAYVSPTGIDSWGDDAMGTDILPAGQSIDMKYSGSDDSGGCVYDIKVVGTQGQEGYLYKVDLCSVSLVTFSDN
jgi:hypothetical protein